MDIFKRGDKVWFEYEKSGHSYERCGFILDGPLDNGFYIIKTEDAVDFCIHKDKIHYERPDKRTKELEEAYSKAEAMCDNSEPRKVCKTCKNREYGLDYTPCAICEDHNKWEPTGGYIYPVGARVRFIFNEKELIGLIQERRLDHRYRISVKGKFYVVTPDSILGYAANWIDDPSIRKAFGVDVNKNDIYENIKKQINKDQLNFHYGLSSIFKLAPNDDAVPFELSEKEKEYIRNDVAATMSYIHELHKNEFYGTGTDTKIFIDDILKEDNKMKNEQKKRNRNIIKAEKYQRTIKDISFNGPAVIVKFEPTGEDLSYGRFKGDKVVVVCKDGDKYDMKTGFLLAILKEFLNNQSYGNILEKLDSFDTFDIPQVGKDDGFKFKIGNIVRLKTGTKKYKVIGQDTINDIKRYRLLSYNSNSNYTFYERENRLILADEVYRK